jgi:hypothetical protein
LKDAVFIKEKLERGKAAGEKVKAAFSDLSIEQLNWKPSPESWSIGQCLDHLVVSDMLYFPALDKIAEGNYKKTAWQRWSPFSGLFGKILVNQLQEKVTKKAKAPQVLLPSASQIDMGIVERFHKHLDTLLEYISAFSNVDLDKTVITSPVFKFVTYNLRNTVTLLTNHLHRHINQGCRVKANKEFPSI